MDDQLEPDDPAFDDPMLERAAHVGRSRSWGRTWRIVAIVLAVLAGVAGLATVGVAIFFMWAISSYGSNK